MIIKMRFTDLNGVFTTIDIITAITEQCAKPLALSRATYRKTMITRKMPPPSYFGSPKFPEHFFITTLEKPGRYLRAQHTAVKSYFCTYYYTEISYW